MTIEHFFISETLNKSVFKKEESKIYDLYHIGLVCTDKVVITEDHKVMWRTERSFEDKISQPSVILWSDC
jgi:hypothetical protein